MKYRFGGTAMEQEKKLFSTNEVSFVTNTLFASLQKEDSK